MTGTAIKDVLKNEPAEMRSSDPGSPINDDPSLTITPAGLLETESVVSAMQSAKIRRTLRLCLFVLLLILTAVTMIMQHITDLPGGSVLYMLLMGALFTTAEVLLLQA